MTPEICLISVPHNGTIFVRNVFVTHGWAEQGLNGRPGRDPTLFHGHCEKVTQCLDAIDLAQRMPVVMPLRHPYRVEESWKRRGKARSAMMQAYNHMFDLLEEHVTAWLPLDAEPEIRDRAHDELNHMAGKRLDVDFGAFVNVEKFTYDLDLSTLNPSHQVREMRKRPLFQRFYGHADRL